MKSGEELEKEPESDICEEDNDEVSLPTTIKFTLMIALTKKSVQENEDGGNGKTGDSLENFQGTGRTVTLQMLLAAKMLEPGKSTMTIEYLGQKFVGDLLADGKIKSQETETIFCSPSAWAMHCKRIINPEKKSGCGWASVKYKGKKLDAYKAQWLRKCQQQKDSTLSDGEPMFMWLYFYLNTRIFYTDEQEGARKRPKKELSPVPTIKRIVLPHNTVSNRNVVQ